MASILIESPYFKRWLGCAPRTDDMAQMLDDIRKVEPLPVDRHREEFKRRISEFIPCEILKWSTAPRARRNAL